MSTLIAELHRNVRTDEAVVVLRDRGLGSITLDQIGYEAMFRHSTEIFLQLARERLASMYFYCAPRTPTKSITMTWEQALQTSQFLKETI